MRIEWINCLTGVCGTVSVFPAEMLSEGNTPGVSFRSTSAGDVSICPDFRAREIFIDGEIALAPKMLEAGVPVTLQMGRRLLVLCAVSAAGGDGWAQNYRFPLWTLFETETLEALETVRVPAELPAALKRSRMPEAECGASPYGLPVVFPLAQVLPLFVPATAQTN